MIKFINPSPDLPYLRLKQEYNNATNAKQKNIEAVSISSYSKQANEVNSRFVNLKFVDNNQFIFFSNYKSVKSQEFYEHSQISALIFWNNTNTQIRFKAHIKKTTKEYNRSYFQSRSDKKNALAISSNQSLPIDSYNDVKANYIKSLETDNLRQCPEFWGGYSFRPYYFEFWKGHDSRLNRREVFEIDNGNWNHYLLQP